MAGRAERGDAGGLDGGRIGEVGRPLDRAQIDRLLEDWKKGRDAPPALRVSIALTLSGLVWPGLGQLYNRQFRKGLVLMALAAAATLLFVLGAGSNLLEVLRAGPSLADPDGVLAVADRVLTRGSGGITAAGLAMMAVWVVGVVDAYLGARSPRRRSG